MKQIETSLNGRILTARLNNPPHNFLTTQMVKELVGLVDMAEADSHIRVAVLTGAVPDIFISHFDVGEIAEGGDQAGKQLDAKAAGKVLKLLGFLLRLPGLPARLEKGPLAGIINLIRMHQLFARMEISPVVFIAAINGRALGGGFELALACDFRLIAQETGSLGFPELNQGIIPGAGGTQRLTRIVGSGRAGSLILQSQLLDAQQALDLGIVHAVVPAADLAGQAQALAEELSRRTRESVAAAKTAIRAAFTLDGDTQERIGFLAAASTPIANAALKQYHQRLKSVTPGAGHLEAEIEQWRAGQVMDLVGN